MMPSGNDSQKLQKKKLNSEKLPMNSMVDLSHQWCQITTGKTCKKQQFNKSCYISYQSSITTQALFKKTSNSLNSQFRYCWSLHFSQQYLNMYYLNHFSNIITTNHILHLSLFQNHHYTSFIFIIITVNTPLPHSFLLKPNCWPSFNVVWCSSVFLCL